MKKDLIIKALECCISGDDCTICPLCDEQSCPCVLNENALALINELAEENERLASLCTSKDVIIGDMNAENERLRAEISVKKKLLDKSVEVEDKVKADTVRKMQERLLKRFGDDSNRVFSNYNIHRYIDQIAKEMLEGNE